jgi:hypothetical protein
MASTSEYEKVLEALYAQGWTPDQGVPTELIEASNRDQGGSVGVGDPPVYPTGEPPSGAPQAMPEATGTPQAGAGTGALEGVFEGMTDEDADIYAGMGDLGRQRKQAEAMRDTKALEGFLVNNGRTYVADSPVAHIVRGAKIHKGKKDTDRIGGEQTTGRRSFIDLLRKRKTSKDLTPEEIAKGEGWTEEELEEAVE